MKCMVNNGFMQCTYRQIRCVCVCVCGYRQTGCACGYIIGTDVGMQDNHPDLCE